jgi:hypothetical protein
MAWVAGGLWVGDYIFERRLKEINVEIDEINAVRRCPHPHPRLGRIYGWAHVVCIVLPHVRE